MKIAIPTKGDYVDDHFGHCEYFTIFEVDEDKKVISWEKLTSPVGCGCRSNVIPLLAHSGVRVMLAGNMGDGAIYNLNSFGISVIRGCSGNISDVLHSWINGEITDSGIACNSHDCDQ
ncbi:MAG: NifB/NifX family molybdenum-iron cluster-binding protein [Candidatus Marinimicrobia bacterium]|nr:NifB/NifX family molybdenum-iron cluster-binding protein [Candidatus Neomarinimicrobiota bacterium]MBL7046890.1 NifB/NifX family molybdenum-iron cluster-binding protein [Candidatus Neomarinimicrobiota bacterium]